MYISGVAYLHLSIARDPTYFPWSREGQSPSSLSSILWTTGVKEGRWLPSHSCYCSGDPGLSLQVVLFVYPKVLVILRGEKVGYAFALKTDAKCPPPQHFNHLISSRRTVSFISSNQKALILMPCSRVSAGVLKTLPPHQFSFMRSIREYLY